MSESSLNPLESILRLCAAAAPEPWYPRLFAKQSGVDTYALGQCLEELWLSGLIERKPGTEESGPAISLTRAGERVLFDPEALQRLRAGEALFPGDRSASVRQALHGRLRPHITVLLVLANVLVFAAGYYQARQHGVDALFLQGAVNGPVLKILAASGAIVPDGLVAGQWWRLLAAGFVHIGFMHILMNMACLYLAGRTIERLWGHVRYLVIYLAGLLGGSVLMAAHPVDVAAGASGAVCGILAAEAVWFFFNRRYLPRALRRQERMRFVINFILLVFISSFKNVSGWGHFGGAAAGAMAALLMHLHRFGPAGWRWLALTGFVPLLWYSQHIIEQARGTDKVWLKAEDQHFEKTLATPLQRTMTRAERVYRGEIQPVLGRHPTRRDAAEAEAAQRRAADQKHELEALAEQLAHAGPYHSQEAEEARTMGRAYVRAGIELFEEAEHHLEIGEQRTEEDRQALHGKEEAFQRAEQDWNELFQ